MEAIPQEFLLHYHPVMTIVRPPGINAPAPSTPGTPQPASAALPSRRTSLGPGHHRRASSSAGIHSKPTGAVLQGEKLIDMLLSGLTAKPKDVVWDAGGRGQFYSAFTVAHDHRFIPIKPKSAPGQKHPEMSLLCPLNPDSPIFPDGIISADWIRRHLNDIPAVVVGIFSLWDRTEHDDVQGPLGVVSAKEREMDELLAKEMIDMRDRVSAVDVKFAAVVVLKRSHLGDHAVEERLVAVRRASQLDSRTGFFVLAPGDVGDVQVFINTLQKGLQETTISHYRDLSRRCKKRKSSAIRPTGPDSPHPITWNVRADFKLGVYAEFRQDFESALKHFEAAHHGITDLFAARSKGGDGAAVLRRGTERWTEALMLADCINLKMCKYHLYAENHVEALMQLKRHVDAFRQVHDDRGIRASHFEFLAWQSRQYRLFADLLDIGMRAGLKLPTAATLQAAPTANPAGSDYRPFGAGFGSTPQPMGVNPLLLLQHPGYYYFTAANLATERRKSFRKSLEEDGRRRTRKDLFEEQAIEQERGVDHATMCVELLTKSYEHFKKHKHGRMTLYLASEIADEYFEAAKYEMALKFYDRIAKNYRKEKWTSVLKNILQRSLDCAKQLRLWNKVVEYLIELLCDKIDMSEGERAAIQQELVDILKGHYPDEDVKDAKKGDASSDDDTLKKAVVDMDQIVSFISCDALFRRISGHIGDPSVFQISFKPGLESPPMPLEFDRIEVNFSHPEFRHIIQTCRDRDRNKFHFIDAKTAAWDDTQSAWVTEGDLLLNRTGEIWIEGEIEPKQPAEIKVMSVSAFIKSLEWEVELIYKIAERSASKSPPRWLKRSVDDDGLEAHSVVMLNAAQNYSVMRATRRQPKFAVKTHFSSPAYLLEQFHVELELINSENEPIHAWLAEAEARLPGTLNLSEAMDYVGLEPAAEDQKTGRIEKEDVGVVAPGESKKVSIYFCPSEGAGERALYIKVQYRPSSSAASEDSYETEIVTPIHVVTPFEPSFDVYPVGPTAGGPHMGWKDDEESYDQQEHTAMPVRLEETVAYTMLTKLRLVGPWGIDVESDKPSFKLMSLSTLPKEEGGTGFKSQSWDAGQVFHVNQMFSRTIPDATFDRDAPSQPTECGSPGKLEVIWRRKFANEIDPLMDHIPYTRSIISLPSLLLHPTELVIVPQLPAYAHTEEIFPISYTLWNRSRRRTQDVTVYLDTEGLASTSADTIGYVWSGYKQIRVRIPPGAERVLRWNLYPVRGGRCKMPKLRVERGEAGAGGEVIAVMIGKEVWVKDRLASVPASVANAGTQGSDANQTAIAIHGPTEMDEAGILFVRPRRTFSQE